MITNKPDAIALKALTSLVLPKAAVMSKNLPFKVFPVTYSRQEGWAIEKTEFGHYVPASIWLDGFVCDGKYYPVEVIIKMPYKQPSYFDLTVSSKQRVRL